MSDDAYAIELRTRAGRVLDSHPDLRHRWSASGELEFPASSDQGFDVALQPTANDIVVTTSLGFHEHFEGPAPEAVQAALGLVRDLLSPDMRVREQWAGSRAYRWHLERRDADGWVAQSQTGMLFWNYFGSRNERIYQNAHLPGRLDQADHD